MLTQGYSVYGGSSSFAPALVNKCLLAETFMGVIITDLHSGGMVGGGAGGAGGAGGRFLTDSGSEGST